ncbi:MAG: hypothetical protein ACXWU1_10405 [Allosphingosinicella sp.]
MTHGIYCGKGDQDDNRQCATDQQPRTGSSGTPIGRHRLLPAVLVEIGHFRA